MDAVFTIVSLFLGSLFLFYFFYVFFLFRLNRLVKDCSLFFFFPKERIYIRKRARIEKQKEIVYCMIIDIRL